MTLREIVLEPNDIIGEIKEMQDNQFLKLKNFESYQDPHSLCKQIKRLKNRIIVGIYVNPTGTWSSVIPYAFSNHHDRFINWK